MKQKRKAQSSVNPVGLVIVFLLLAFTAYVVIHMLIENIAGASTTFGSLNLNNRHQLCELAGKKIIDRGQEPKEEIEGDNKDNFPDDCDLCLGGDDSKVTNSYGIPDACYKDPIKNKKVKTYKDMCKARGGCYISDTDQCCLLGENKCGEKCK